MNKPSWLPLAGYGAVAAVLSFVHDSRVLVFFLLLALLFSGRQCAVVARAMALPWLLVNVPLTLTAVLAFIVQTQAVPWPNLLLINLRSALFLFIAMTVVRRYSLPALCADWPNVQRFVVLACAQMRSLAALSQDFRMAFASRTAGKAHWGSIFRHAATQSEALLEQALCNAEDINAAMISRCAWGAAAHHDTQSPSPAAPERNAP